MRYLISLWVVVGIVGTFMACSFSRHTPKFKVGDCILDAVLEDWQVDQIKLVVQLGRSHYRVAHLDSQETPVLVYVGVSFDADDLFNQVVCPSGLK